MSDEILTKLIDKLEQENADLKRQLKEKPRPIFGVSRMWESYCESEGAQVVSALVGLAFILASSIVSYNVLVPDEPPARLTNVFHMDAWDDCYYVVQERTNGSTDRVSACIKDKDEAVKFLSEMKREASENDSR